MTHLKPFALMLLASACTSGGLVEPSLAPRAAESIDPRVPVPDQPDRGTLDAALVERLGQLVETARGGVPAFEARQFEAERLARSAGPMASESWIAAQQALSRLIEQYGVTTRVAADIDQLFSSELADNRWIEPADREAIAASAEDVALISRSQSEAIDRLNSQLRR